MRSWLTGALIGVGAGVIAAAGMDLFQRIAAPLFDEGDGGGEPATVKAADAIGEEVADEPVPKPWRQASGTAVHYATGIGAGALYGVLAAEHPGVTAGFGTAYGTALMLVLDDTLVPAFGWGTSPFGMSARTHAYSLTSHLVFGALLEGGRRAGAALAR